MCAHACVTVKCVGWPEIGTQHFNRQIALMQCRNEETGKKQNSFHLFACASDARCDAESILQAKFVPYRAAMTGGTHESCKIPLDRARRTRSLLHA